MSDLNANERWQVDVNGQVYEANFEELTDWIAEGSLQPEDKVRRGNLRWIDAGRVPTLSRFFAAKAAGTPITVTVTQLPPEPDVRSATETVQDVSARVVLSQVNAPSPSVDPAHVNRKGEEVSDQCLNHPDRNAPLRCLSCHTDLCRECVKAFGSSVAICSACGGLCKPRSELEQAAAVDDFRSQAIKSGFGFADFGKAIYYPFKFKSSLIFGALMFMFFSLGRMASSFGGIYMLVASIFSYMLANMLAFGILSNTIERFAHGKIGGNFMPDFEDFSLWDEVIHPFFLSIGVWISSFGPFIAVLLLGSYLVISSVNSELSTMKSSLENTPGTPYYSARNTLDQSNQVRIVLENSERINQEHLDAQEQIENGDQPAVLDHEEEDFQRVNKMIADNKRQELEAVVGKSAETRDRESAAFVSGLLKLAAPIVVAGFIALLWALLFFPASCMVAGYTKSFSATVNPLVGLDTIRRLGSDYVKVLLMSLLLVIAFGVVSTMFAVAFAAFDMPGMGNLPARALDSVVWFYLTIVFACILGFVMFKASDRLELSN